VLQLIQNFVGENSNTFIDETSISNKDQSENSSESRDITITSNSKESTANKNHCKNYYCYYIAILVFVLFIVMVVLLPSVKTEIIFCLSKYIGDLRYFVRKSPIISNTIFWVFQFLGSFLLPSKGFPSIVIAYIQKDFKLSMIINISSLV